MIESQNPDNDPDPSYIKPKHAALRLLSYRSTP